LGRLHLVASRHPIDEVDAMALDRAAAAVGLCLLSDREGDTLLERAGSTLVLKILGGRTTSSAEVSQRAKALNVNLASGNLACLVIRLQGVVSTGGNTSGRGQELRRLGSAALSEVRDALANSDAKGLVAVDGAHVLAVIELRTTDSGRSSLIDLGRTLTSRIESRVGLTSVVGVQELVTVDTIHRGLHDAIDAADFGADTADDVHFANDLGVTYLLTRMSDGPDLACFVERSLKPLLDHDATTSSPLIPTLATYLEHNASKSSTARALHIDRRTLYHRLDRIEGLLGHPLDNVETSLELAIALKGLTLLRRRSATHS
jgi:purine catabolism regulator